MVTFPITVRRNGYHGSDARKTARATKENRAAALLEDYANRKLLSQTEPVRVYLWMELAIATRLPYTIVAKLGLSIDGGSDGFTAWRHDMTQDAALAASEQEVVSPERRADV